MKIKLYRVVLNILFYVFYVIIISVIFSFVFPAIRVFLWKDIIAPTNPIFDTIQIIIIILVLLISLLFRKYFYLPIKDKSIKKKVFNKGKKEKKKEKRKEESEESDLDIKIGKEIK